MAEDPEDQDAPTPMSVAEQAAAAGDYATAERLLAATAERQQARLGPLHPDLANTLNNLGIVYEINKKAADAERSFRRAFEIAQAALPPDHPFVATSRKNLEDFCRARGIPFEPPAESASPLLAPAPEPETTPVRDVPSVRPTERTPTEEPARQAPVLAPGRVPVAAIAIAALAVLMVIVIAVVSLRHDETPRPAETTPPAQPVTPAAPRDTPSTAATPAETPAPTAPPSSPPPATEQSLKAERVEAKPSDTERPTVDAAQLCRELSTGGAWRCLPAASPVAPGVLYFYSRLKSPRDTSVEHRWYLGDRLRQSVTLQIRANMFAGYRTYSRQTVGQRGRWRVEMRSRDGTVLHEEQFDVE